MTGERAHHSSVRARSRDAGTLAGLLVVIGTIVAVIAGRRGATGDGQAWFFALVGASTAVAGLVLALSRVRIVGDHLVIRNGFRTHELAASDIVSVRSSDPTYPTDPTGGTLRTEETDGTNSTLAHDRPGRRTRTTVPVVVPASGRPVGVWSLLVEPALGRRSVGADGHRALLDELATALDRARRGGPSAPVIESRPTGLDGPLG